MKSGLIVNFSAFLLLCCFSHIAAAQNNDSVTVSSAAAVEPSTDGWISIQGQSITIWCLPDANLRKLEARLRTRDVPMNQEYRALLSNHSLSIEDRLKARIEIILLRVEDILGMDPKDLHVKIRIFKTRQEMNDAYAWMFNEQANFKSFYMHYFRSIYSNEQDFLDSVMAHELGHAVIDHYFSVPPPTRMAELMATYVDAQLDQE
jgi:hypothetical protein